MRNTACSNTAFLDGNRESEDSKAFGIFDVVLAVPAGGSGSSRFSAGLAILNIERPEFCSAKGW